MMKRKAFTFWEALVVVAIVCIGAAILMPPGMGRARQNARRSSCASNLKQINLGFLQYAQDADKKAPSVANIGGGWTQLLQPYLKSAAIFQCPSTDNKIGTTDYYFNARLAGSKDKLVVSAKPIFTILCGEGAADAGASANLSQLPAAWRTDESSPAWRHLDGANYGFIDGHVKWLKPEQATMQPPAMGAPTFLVR